MKREVIGAGMMFLGSGCGPALSEEQREYLKNIKPDSFYPLDTLLDMFNKVQQTKPELIYAAGRRWGNAVSEDMIGRGATRINDGMKMICSVYQEHHHGDVGELVIQKEGREDGGRHYVILANDGPYPTMLIVGAFQSFAAAMGAEDVEIEEMDSPHIYRISWTEDDPT